MPDSSTAKRISPMLAVADMEESIAFYQNVLGFALILKSPECSLMERDGQTLHFQKGCIRSHEVCPWAYRAIHRGFRDPFSLGTRENLQESPQNQGTLDREYGMTEFHITDPNECLVFVGYFQMTLGSGVCNCPNRGK